MQALSANRNTIHPIDHLFHLPPLHRILTFMIFDVRIKIDLIKILKISTLGNNNMLAET